MVVVRFVVWVLRRDGVRAQSFFWEEELVRFYCCWRVVVVISQRVSPSVSAPRTMLLYLEPEGNYVMPGLFFGV